MSLQKDLDLLRRVLIDEQTAINSYEDFLGQIQDEEARKILKHITDEEREHSAEMLKLIMKLDPVQAEKVKAELFQGGAHSMSTVGNLKEGGR